MEQTAEQLEPLAATRADARVTMAPDRALLDGMRLPAELHRKVLELRARLEPETRMRVAEHRLREREEAT